MACAVGKQPSILLINPGSLILNKYINKMPREPTLQTTMSIFDWVNFSVPGDSNRELWTRELHGDKNSSLFPPNTRFNTAAITIILLNLSPIPRFHCGKKMQ